MTLFFRQARVRIGATSTHDHNYPLIDGVYTITFAKVCMLKEISVLLEPK